MVSCRSSDLDTRLDALDLLPGLDFPASLALQKFWTVRMIDALIIPMQGKTPSSIHECDRIAADPRDPLRVQDVGIPTKQLDARLAIRVCGRALDAYPNTARFQYQLARAYRKSHQLGRSLGFLQKAAASGYRMAQAALGEIYLIRGQKLELDLAPAIRWLESAAVAGAPIAQYQLGRLLYQGHYVARDPRRARILFADSARAGYARAQRTVGGLNMTGGDGINQNFKKGLNWLTKAAHGGDPEAQMLLAKLLRYDEKISKNMTQAFHWLRQAACAGHPTAQAQFGGDLLGYGALTADLRQAYFWLSLAVRAGIQEVIPLLAYASNQLESTQLKVLDRKIPLWQPYDSPPIVSEPAVSEPAVSEPAITKINPGQKVTSQLETNISSKSASTQKTEIIKKVEICDARKTIKITDMDNDDNDNGWWLW